jgi:hypothetical protein
MHNVFRIAAGSLIALTIPFSGVRGLVLCVGAGGHVALEIAHGSHCEDAHEGREQDEQGELALTTGTDAQCCPPCVDVPLSSDTMSQPVSEVRRGAGPETSLGKLLVASASGVGLAWDRTGVASSVPLPIASRASPFLSAHRTIVLRV